MGLLRLLGRLRDRLLADDEREPDLSRSDAATMAAATMRFDRAGAATETGPRYRSETIGQVEMGSSVIDDEALNQLARDGWLLKGVVAGLPYVNRYEVSVPGQVIGIFERAK